MKRMSWLTLVPPLLPLQLVGMPHSSDTDTAPSNTAP